MDNQDHQAPINNEQPNSSTPPAPTPPLVKPVVQATKPLNLTDSEAQALLAINNVQVADHKHRSGPSLTLMISVAVLVVAVILVAYLVSSFKPAANSKNGSSNTGSSSQTNNSANGSASNQINQDVNSCSNPLTAVSQC